MLTRPLFGERKINNDTKKRVRFFTVALRKLFVRRTPVGVAVGKRRRGKVADGSPGKRHIHCVLDSDGHRILRRQSRSGRISVDETSENRRNVL